MKIQWMGHACFLLETEKGTKIITDPYEPGSFSGAVGYDSISIEPDVVTVSHQQHADHNYTKDFRSATVVDKTGNFKIKDIEIEGILSYHDKSQGKERGENIIFIVQADGLRVGHFGDLGTTEIEDEKIKGIDIALVPVGGTFTIDHKEADQLLERIIPKVFIPMHFKTRKLGFDIDGVEKFLQGKDYGRENSLEVSPQNIGSFKKIIVLEHQR